MRGRGATDIPSLAAMGFQDDAIAGDDFREALHQSLDDGAFRLVWVLDDAPPELVSTVGYLEAISSGVVIDLVVVGQYEVGGEKVIVPQRIEPARVEAEQPGPKRPGAVESGGAGDFVASIKSAAAAEQPKLARLAEWSAGLENAGLAEQWTKTGADGRKVLKPCVPAEGVGLVTIFNDDGASIALWRSVFERCAPESIARLEALGVQVGQGFSIYEFPDELLDALAQAYREAAGREE